jgi:hypothetical protein
MWQMDIPIVVVIWIQDRHNMHYGLNTWSLNTLTFHSSLFPLQINIDNSKHLQNQIQISIPK